MAGEKRFKTYDEQIAFLEDKKGLIISNKEYAKGILLNVGYFSLINGYKEIFKNPSDNQFKKGTTFEDIYDLYCFDNDIRNIFLKYILAIDDVKFKFTKMDHFNFTSLDHRGYSNTSITSFVL